MIILAQLTFPPTAIDYFVIASVLFAIIGTLFLAYDLLGRENGPLRWFTLVISCALVSAFVLATIGGLLRRLTNNAFDLNTTLLLMVLGGLMGFFTVILVELPASQARPPIFSHWGSLIGVALGLTFALVIVYILSGPLEAALAIVLPCMVITSVWQRITWEPSQAVSKPRGIWRFVAWEEPSPSNPNPLGSWKFVDWEPPHPRPHIFSRKRFLLGLALGFVCWFVVFFIASRDITVALLESVPLALVCGGISSTWRFINWEPPHRKPHLFSRKGFWTGLVAGSVPWLIFQIQWSELLLQQGSGPVAGLLDMLTLWIILLVVGALALATAAAGSIAQYILWRANRLPHRTLGVFGLVLILLATSLQGVPAVIDLMGGTPK